MNFEKVVSVLISSKTQTQACKTLGITQATLNCYMKDNEFLKVLNKVSESNLMKASAKVNNALTLAIDTLIEIIESKETNASEKIKACNSIISHALTLEELSIKKRNINAGVSEVLLSILEIEKRRNEIEMLP